MRNRVFWIIAIVWVVIGIGSLATQKAKKAVPTTRPADTKPVKPDKPAPDPCPD